VATSASSPRVGQQTGVRGREAILDAAAVLMDEHGIDHVSLNEINRASGNRNRSAVTYHFGSRDAIIVALVDRGKGGVDADRNALLDQAELAGRTLGVREGVELTIGPMAQRLNDEGGRRYLRLLGQLINHPRFVSDAGEAIFTSPSVVRCLPLIAPALDHLPEPVRAERVSSMVGFVIRCMSEQARLIDLEERPREPLPVDQFVTNLADVMMAVFSAPTTVNTSGKVTGGTSGVAVGG
jgi:AcrR family transcriptional regulator